MSPGGRPGLQVLPVARLQILVWFLHAEAGTSPLSGPAPFAPLAAVGHCRWHTSHSVGLSTCPSALLSHALGTPGLPGCPPQVTASTIIPLSLPEYSVALDGALCLF